MKKVTVYYNNPQERGYKPVGSFALEGNRIVLTVLDPAQKGDLEEFLQGVRSHDSRRVVMPTEGELFLQTICEFYGNSTYWRAQAD